MLYQPNCTPWWNDYGWKKKEQKVCEGSWDHLHGTLNSSFGQYGMDVLSEELKISRIGRLQEW